MNLLLVFGVVACGLVRACAADQPWTSGRATWFDIGPDLSTANCHFSWVPTGRYVGAWSDQQEGFESSCGRCFEVKCRNAAVTDGYGQTLNREKACYDESKSVVITIADACPCRYPNNQYSNQRWCCGDQNHLDISAEAFQQLADPNVGVIGLCYREVDCSTQGSPGGTSGSSDGGNGSGSGDGNGNGGDNGGGNTNDGSGSNSDNSSGSGNGNGNEGVSSGGFTTGTGYTVHKSSQSWQPSRNQQGAPSWGTAWRSWWRG